MKRISLKSASRLMAVISGTCFLGVAQAKPVFQELLFNPHWYRSYDTSSSIIPAEGTLLFAWNFTDAAHQPDSFFIGIDTLWGLPQDLGNDTASDWDLQVCPDGICMNGLKENVHGANSPYPFETGHFEAEHHFQFFPAIDKDFNFTAPAHSLFGAMMFCRSRSTGQADTVFAFGGWNLEWDSAFTPPVRPVAGYLPKLADFTISGDTVRYLKSGAGIRRAGAERTDGAGIRWRAEPGGVRIAWAPKASAPEVSVLSLDGKVIWRSGRLGAGQATVLWPEAPVRPGARQGIGIVKVAWPGGASQAGIYSPVR